MDNDPGALRAELLAKIEASSRLQEDLLRRSLEIVRRPGTFGWRASLASGTMAVPLGAVALALHDLTYILAARGGSTPKDASPSPSSTSGADPGPTA